MGRAATTRNESSEALALVTRPTLWGVPGRPGEGALHRALRSWALTRASTTSPLGTGWSWRGWRRHPGRWSTCTTRSWPAVLWRHCASSATGARRRRRRCGASAGPGGVPVLRDGGGRAWQSSAEPDPLAGSEADQVGRPKIGDQPPSVPRPAGRLSSARRRPDSPPRTTGSC